MERSKFTCDGCGTIVAVEKYEHPVGWAEVCRRKTKKGRYTNRNYCGKCSDKKKIQQMKGKCYGN